MITIKSFGRKTIFFGIFLFCIQLLNAQNGDVRKANKEYDKYDFIDARDIYLMVVEDGYHSAEIFKKLGDTYYYNSDYTNASKWYTRLLDTYPNDVDTEYYYRAAQALKSISNYADSDVLMEKYVALGGEERVVQVFENDPEYLKSLGVEPFKYVINKISVNSKFSDFGPSYYKDKIVFASSTKDLSNFKTHNWNNLPYLDLYEASIDKYGNLSDPVPLKGDVNTIYHESSTSFSKNGKTVYFTRNNYTNGKKKSDRQRTMRLKLYKATISETGDWVNVLELPFNDEEYSVAHPALSLDEKRLYFASDMPGTFGRSDLWYVEILGNNMYGPPVNLGEKVNTKARETFPFVSEKNNLYFSSDGHGGFGGLDIFIIPIDEEGELGKITNFGEPINSNFDDFGFITKESEGTGFYTSNVDGGRGSIDDEIFRFVEECVMTINVVVRDIDTQELLPGAEVSILDENYQVIQKVTVGEDATVTFTKECDTKYTLLGTKKDYFPNEKTLVTPDEGGVVDVTLELKHKEICPPNDLGCRLSLQPIYFDYDRSEIRPDAAVELAKILAALRKYSELVISIESHTDSRGRDSYNLKLSDRRAQSTLNWLVDKGISRARLSAKGYGETQLVNHCGNDVECTEEEHQLNRRSMFIIQDLNSTVTNN
ncbi:OmpA family protein [Ulvibacter litoralis]|uniref:WD40-like Beta Propeller Repeat n=1 Tax=Ulvibacter litoralis TaxID=227084 RepID=A0A1G7IWR4_9FLAO|nr:OmpA family protein [Ulvibacter litoralis]SDF17130.1 WD40-like Beta Propeller Repeat [Ulvibacter litoralis]